MLLKKMTQEAKRKAERSIHTHTSTKKDLNLLSRSVSAESFVVWKMAMRPISIARLSPEGEENQKPYPV